MDLFELLIALAITAGATAGMLTLASDVEAELIPTYEQHYKQFEKFKQTQNTEHS